jgi:formate dehydrogenase major subunit
VRLSICRTHGENLRPLPRRLCRITNRAAAVDQTALKADGGALGWDPREYRQETFEKRTRKALSEASGPRPVDVGTNESALTIHKRRLDKRRHTGLEGVGTCFETRPGDREMQTSRRDFFKLAAVGGVATTIFGFDLKPAYAQLKELKIARAAETRSTCPYCAVGCGVLIYTIGDSAKNVTPQVIHVEGDPDHPTNRGTLCPKGSSLEQDMLNPRRLTKPQVRRPGATDWQDISWDDALNEIARWTKNTRDSSFVEKDANGRTVNRCEGISFIGGCTDTNEFNFLAVKAMRGLGLVYLENQARV